MLWYARPVAFPPQSDRLTLTQPSRLRPFGNGGSVGPSFTRSSKSMVAPFTLWVRQPLQLARMTALAAALIVPSLAAPAVARGPDNIADVAEAVIDSVVNISTS